MAAKTPDKTVKIKTVFFGQSFAIQRVICCKKSPSTWQQAQTDLT